MLGYTRSCLALLTLLLLTALPVEAQRGNRYFPETGFIVDGAILAAFNEYGGVPVIGLPISDAMETMCEQVACTVQWFERTRIEVHHDDRRAYRGRIGLRAQLEQAYNEKDDLADQLAATQQIGRTFKTRLAEIEKMNQDLVAARDKAEREVKLIKEQQSRKPASALTKQRELERQIEDLRQQLNAAHAALQVAAATDRSSSLQESAMVEATVQELIATCDPALLAELLRSCVVALRRYRELSPPVTPALAHDLYKAIADLIASGDLALLIPFVGACAAALRRYPGPDALPADEARALYAALDDLGPAAVAIYPREAANGRAR